MSTVEVLGFLTGALSVWLAVKEHVWNWPIGIANSAFFLVLLVLRPIPFVQDGLRDGEHIRKWMTERFRQELTLVEDPWICVAGTPEDRSNQAVAAIDRICQSKKPVTSVI